MKLSSALMNLLLLTAVLVTALPACARDGNIRYTVHNMSSQFPGADMRNYVADTMDQVCIFCHTPHNASMTPPLWNKSLPTQAFNMYTSSMTLSSVAKAVTAPGPESILCLSCHDGRTAINRLISSRTETVVSIGGLTGDTNHPDGSTLSMGFFSGMGSYGANLGKLDNVNTNNYFGAKLTDDHPISFSYVQAQAEKGANSLKPIANVDSSIRFFGSNKRLECSSCHDPHIAYGYVNNNPTGVGDTSLRPFLVRTNNDSVLCLSCHNK